MIKLVAFFAAYRLLRQVLTIAIIATLAVLLLSPTRDTAGQGSDVVGKLQRASRPLEQHMQHAMQKATGP